MKKFKCPQCGRVTETVGNAVDCPPLTKHPKGWGRHLKAVAMRPIKKEQAA